MTTNQEGAEMGVRGPPSLHLSTRNGNFLGKHRLSAAISRLNQEIQYLQVLFFPSSSMPTPIILPLGIFLLKRH
ncbi:hypothetical protein GW17_00049116 [Ensete ventricosum]|nr:hypothetical protein GW17_00049116 [Ensete ventricosum]RZS12275.1 hypothetical protein BHM03_00043702 [Ensete ventricosum]